LTDLVLGPLLRFVSDTEATVFVETSDPCEVEILGRSEPTFRVEGHHYALVRLEGLEPGSSQAHEPPYTESKDSNEEGGRSTPSGYLRTR